MARGRVHFHVNTYQPGSRPRYTAEVLAYHEGVPGHHLQIAIQQELEALPEFRRFAGTTAFVEGWGLYSERLADEMGLYYRRPAAAGDALLRGVAGRAPGDRRGDARARLDAPAGH